MRNRTTAIIVCGAAATIAVTVLLWPVQRHDNWAVTVGTDLTVYTPVGESDPVTPIRVLIEGTEETETSLRDAARTRPTVAALFGTVALVAGYMATRRRKQPD